MNYQRVLFKIHVHSTLTKSLKTQGMNHTEMEVDSPGKGFLRALANVDLALTEAFVGEPDVLTSEPSVQLSIEVAHVVLS